MVASELPYLIIGSSGLHEIKITIIMTKFTFNTIGLFTSDNKKMVDFYRDIMGFTTDWNGEEPNVMMRHKDMWLIMFPRKAFEQMTDQEYSYPTGLNGTVELAPFPQEGHYLFFAKN